jgi:ribose 5-phosphate isomerase B
MKIAIGCDHAGFLYKNTIVEKLLNLGHEPIDFGTNSLESVDYPDYIHPIANAILSKEADFGVIICGSGNGVAMTANKHNGIRAALCWMKEIVLLARQHNDANVLAIPARYTSENQAIEMVESFVTTPFEGGRHAVRVNKINC